MGQIKTYIRFSDHQIKTANQGDMLERMEVLAIGCRYSEVSVSMLKTLLVHFRHKPRGFDDMLTEVGCSIIHYLTVENGITDDELAKVAWGLPYESLESYGLTHLRTQN